MAIKVAINGLGRIGRQVLRRLLTDKIFELIAINDTAKPGLLAYLLNHDVQPGASVLAAREGRDCISLKGKDIRTFAEPDPAKLPWKKLKVDLVLECTGLFDTGEKAAAHIGAGAKKALIACAAAADLPAIVYGLNEKTIRSGDRIISAVSPALNCLAPLAKALNESAPIRSGIVLSLRESGGACDRPAPEGDAGKNHLFRLFRAEESAIIPVSPDWAGAMGRLIPELAGKLSFSAQRLPGGGGALILLFAVVEAAGLSAEKLNRAIKAKSGKVLGYNDEEIISPDTAGTAYASLFDATQTLVQPLAEGLYQVQAASWYDPQSSYAAQLVRIARYLAELEGKTETLTAKTESSPLARPGDPGPARKGVSPARPRKAEPRKTFAERNRADRAGEAPLPRKPLINFPK
ncbi:MAG: type I glyceraldehyde-3-phosphate dehydrogenase [Treponema sp.]|jgi:glyceraldehyde 3-phosphate dehydrogenase|nr:type I glyceraldehyde-3-phosphate dehydrogenase [Treponema sp.]